MPPVPLLLPAPGSSCPVPACFSKKPGQISTCPYFCGSQGLVWDAPSTSLSDPIAFLLPSFSLHGNSPCSAASCALHVCNIRLLHTLLDFFGVFSSVYILLCFHLEIVPLLQTMSLLCCQMNTWEALSGSKSCTDDQTLFSHTVS